ncbi:MAG: hypothetical protein Tsb0034_22440 [Ekhidna sp.]
MKIHLTLIALCAMHLGMSQKIAYFPGFELINMEENAGLQYTTSKLLKSYVEDNHDFTILLSDRLGASSYTQIPSLESAAQTAVSQNIRYVIGGEIHHMQGIYIISLGLYDSQTKEQIWHDMAKGAVEQDLDPLLSRLGRSFYTHRSAKTDIEIDEVTEYDQMGVELAQIKVNHFAGLMLGGKHISGEDVMSGFGLAYTYDASSFLFNLDFELYPTSSMHFGDSKADRKLSSGGVSLGVTYPITRKRSTLFVNGGMEYGYTKIREMAFESEYGSAETGLGAYVGGGFLINRNSTVNLRLFVAASIPFYQVENTNLTGVKFGIVTSFAKKKR